MIAFFLVFFKGEIVLFSNKKGESGFQLTIKTCSKCKRGNEAKMSDNGRENTKSPSCWYTIWINMYKLRTTQPEPWQEIYIWKGWPD